MKKLVSLLLAGLTLFSLAACSGGGSGGGGTAAPQNSGTGEGGAVRTLTVANWQGYGSDAEYAVQAFEEANNCKVVHQYFDSEEALLNMLRQGGLGQIDVVLPNMAYVAIGKRENLFQPIDVSRLENYGDLREDIRDVEDVKDADGNILGVPWTWGTTSLGYNPDAISDTVDSWGILWDPAYQNKIAFFDDHTTAVMIAATYAGEDPYDPDLDVVKDTLLSLKANCKLFWSSYDSFAKPYFAGEVVAGSVWSGAATQLNATGQKMTYVYPKEGTIAWVDYWAIPKDAPNEDLAYKWIDWMTSQQFQSTYAADLEMQPPIPSNTKVLDSLSGDVKAALYVDNGLPEKLVFQKEIPEETNQAWLDLWNEVKAS